MPNSKEAKHLVEMIDEIYGVRFTPQQREELKKSVEQGFEAAFRLRAVKLENHDEPFSTFKPYRKNKK